MVSVNDTTLATKIIDATTNYNSSDKKRRADKIELVSEILAGERVSPQLEKHTFGDDGETIGWRFKVDDKRAVWCGEISRARFDEMSEDQRLACGDTDMGWFICIYDETKPAGEQSEVLARALDEETGRRVAEYIAAALSATPL